MVAEDVKICVICKKVGMRAKGFLYLGAMDVCKNCLIHLVGEELSRQEAKSGKGKSRIN